MFRIMAVVRSLLFFKLALLRGLHECSQFRAPFLRGLGLSGVSEFSTLGLSFSRVSSPHSPSKPIWEPRRLVLFFDYSPHPHIYCFA